MTGGYACRPIDMIQRFGYYWPDGDPGECVPDDMDASSYCDQEGQIFRIAYTHKQIEASRSRSPFRVWSPFIPLFVSGPPYPQQS